MIQKKQDKIMQSIKDEKKYLIEEKELKKIQERFSFRNNIRKRIIILYKKSL